MLLHNFDNVSISHVKRIDNQEVDDMAQLAYGYKVPKESIDDFIDFRDKLVCENTQIPKTWGQSLK